MAPAYVPPHKRASVASTEKVEPASPTKVNNPAKRSCQTSSSPSAKRSCQSLWRSEPPVISSPSQLSSALSRSWATAPTATAPSSTSSPATPVKLANTSGLSWRVNAAPVKPKRGEIWHLPADPSDIEAKDPIRSHPDFQRSEVWNHPCLVVSVDEDGIATCFAMTGFSSYTGSARPWRHSNLEAKYPGDQSCQRKRWLLVNTGHTHSHDGLPTLQMKSGSSSKATWVNTEKLFRINSKHIWSPTSKTALMEEAVTFAEIHHRVHFSRIKTAPTSTPSSGNSTPSRRRPTKCAISPSHSRKVPAPQPKPAMPLSGKYAVLVDEGYASDQSESS